MNIQNKIKAQSIGLDLVNYNDNRENIIIELHCYPPYDCRCGECKTIPYPYINELVDINGQMTLVRKLRSA